MPNSAVPMYILYTQTKDRAQSNNDDIEMRLCLTEANYTEDRDMFVLAVASLDHETVITVHVLINAPEKIIMSAVWRAIRA